MLTTAVRVPNQMRLCRIMAPLVPVSSEAVMNATFTIVVTQDADAASGTSATLKHRGSMSGSDLFSDISGWPAYVAE